MSPVTETACLVTTATAQRQRIFAPAQYLQKIPELLQTSLSAIAQTPSSVVIATPAIDSPCLFPHDSPMTRWWLCDSPSIAPIPVRVTQRGYAAMTNLAQPECITSPVRTNAVVLRLAAAIGLAALADWLFYDQPAGISVVVFAIALAGCSLLTNLA